jgi:archaetidylinositol phosphate synthase
LLISGFFDIVDGSVARVTKQTSKKGAFLDSSFDKISEVVIFAGIAFGSLVDPFWCLVALGISILVSYTRARAESLGVELKGIGIGERAERMLVLAVVGMIPLHLLAPSESEMLNRGIYWAVIIVSIVAGITLIQRIAATTKKLSSI